MAVVVPITVSRYGVESMGDLAVRYGAIRSRPTQIGPHPVEVDRLARITAVGPLTVDYDELHRPAHIGDRPVTIDRLDSIIAVGEQTVEHRQGVRRLPVLGWPSIRWRSAYPSRIGSARLEFPERVMRRARRPPVLRATGGRLVVEDEPNRVEEQLLIVFVVLNHATRGTLDPG